MALRTSQPASGVTRLGTKYTNWYVIEQGGRLTVLDGGFTTDWSRFTAILARMGHRPADVDAVLITHHHPDHVGNAERLRSLGARVFSHPDDADFITGKKQLPRMPHVRAASNPWYARYMLHLLVNGITRVPAVAQLNNLTDGEVLDVPGKPRVVHAPGHTAGSCALLIQDRSVLFSGDALVTIDVTRGRQKGPQIIRGPVTEDADRAVESLAALVATNADTVLPGHGDPWTSGIKSAVDIARRPQQFYGST